MLYIKQNTSCIIFLTTPENIKNAVLDIDENGMVVINKRNATIIEKLIKKDSRYKNPSAKAYFDTHGNISSYSQEELFELIANIAKDNSTRTAKRDISILAKYIYKNLTNVLSRIAKGDLSLVDELSNLTHLGASRTEPSLASKICRYIEEWAFANDNFTINDSVVRSMLPYYFLYFDVKFNKNIDNLTYVEFMKYFNLLVEKIREKHPDVTRHEIDHTIWYSYRLDSLRQAVAGAIVKKSKSAKQKVYINCPYINSSAVVFPKSSDPNILY